MPSGGKRPGAGGPKIGVKPRCINLTDEQARLLRMWGKGNMSAGLRWLIRVASPMVHRPPPKSI